jgi:two-component system CheB/CheR fusion protein
LFPVEIDAKSLTAALRELASATESLHKIPVHFEGDVPEDFRDGAAATQLYRIAQEAVTNAIKHARATAISIQIDGRAGAFRLQIADNGIGINHAAPGNGVGLQIMRHRAKSIVGGLTIENGTQGGTTVTCVLRPVPTRRHMRTTPTEN